MILRDKTQVWEIISRFSGQHRESLHKMAPAIISGQKAEFFFFLILYRRSGSEGAVFGGSVETPLVQVRAAEDLR